MKNSLTFITHPWSNSNNNKINPFKRAIVFLHGLGADGNDFKDLPELLNLDKGLGIKYVFPHAPVIPVTINGGMEMHAWYDILSQDFEREIDVSSILRSKSLIHKLLNDLVKEGIPAENIVLGGFSQGGAISLEAGLHYSKKLAGLISLSAYCLNIKEVKEGNLDKYKTLPIFMAHGHQDQMVPFDIAQQHYQIFKERQFCINWHEDRGLAHNLNNKEILLLKDWLNNLFGD